MQEAACSGVHANFLALSFDIEPVERLDRAVRLAMDRAEGSEVMQPYQLLRRLVHRPVIEILRHQPGAVLVERERRAPVGDAIDVGSADARKARMPVVGHHFALRDRDRFGAQVRVESFHQPEGRDVLCNVDMATHGERMHTGIGPARAMQPQLLAQHAEGGLLDRLLHARPVLLPLEAEEGRSVELESEREAGHRGGILPRPVIPAQAGIRPTLRTGKRVSGPPPSRG